MSIESTGDLPPDADARRVLARFARAADEPDATPAGADAAAAWLVPLRGAHPAAAAQAQTAVRYRPPADSFFRHQDPVARIAALPGLLAIDIAPRAPWPPLDELDPFSCNLVITALLRRFARGHRGRARRRAPALRRRGARNTHERRRCGIRSPQRARELLEAQVALLAEAGAARAWPHRLGRARRRERAAPPRQTPPRPTHVAAAAAASIAEGSPQRLRQALATALGGDAERDARPSLLPHAATTAAPRRCA